MIMQKKILTLLVLLMTAVTGAMAKKDYYAVTFSGCDANVLNTTVYVTLPSTIERIGEDFYDAYDVMGEQYGDFTTVYLKSGGDGKVSVTYDDWGMYITITGAFEGTATIHCEAFDEEDEETGSRDIYVACVYGYEAYDVTYDANGGSGAPSAQEKRNGTDLTLSTAEPTREGFPFFGWNTAQDGSGDSYAPGATYTANADVTLYAQWTAPAPAADPGYYLVGTMTSWEIDPQYKLAENPGNAAEQMIALCLEAGAEFKVVYTSNGTAKDNWFPAEAGNYSVTAADLYTIYFRSNYDGDPKYWYNGCIYVADGVSFTADGTAWTLAQMPACDLEMEVEYYPLATLATTPAAAEGLNDATTADLLTPGTSNEGTLYYALGTSEAPTGQWSQTIPTTEGLDAGEYYVWYKVVGDDQHSDSQPQSIAVTVAALPAFAVTIDDGDVNTDKWEADPEQPKAGQTVTLSYSGKKKIRSITIEKKAEAPAGPTLAETMTTAGMTVKVNYNYYNEENYCLFTSNGDGTYTYQSGEGFAGGNENCARALVVEDGKLVFKLNFNVTIDDGWDRFGFSVTFDTSNNTYTQWAGVASQDAFSPSLTSVEVNGTAIAVTAAQ